MRGLEEEEKKSDGVKETETCIDRGEEEGEKSLLKRLRLRDKEVNDVKKLKISL